MYINISRNKFCYEAKTTIYNYIRLSKFHITISDYGYYVGNYEYITCGKWKESFAKGGRQWAIKYCENDKDCALHFDTHGYFVILHSKPIEYKYKKPHGKIITERIRILPHPINMFISRVEYFFKGIYNWRYFEFKDKGKNILTLKLFGSAILKDITDAIMNKSSTTAPERDNEHENINWLLFVCNRDDDWGYCYLHYQKLVERSSGYYLKFKLFPPRNVETTLRILHERKDCILSCLPKDIFKIILHWTYVVY